MIDFKINLVVVVIIKVIIAIIRIMVITKQDIYLAMNHKDRVLINPISKTRKRILFVSN